MEPVSFFLMFSRVRSAVSRERLLIKTCSAIFWASKGVLDEVDLQLGAEEVGHGLLDELVVDGLLGLVLIGGLGGEVVGHQHQGVLDVVEGDLGLVLLVLPCCFR